MQDNARHKMSKPLISFIMPYHNESPDMVEACISSIHEAQKDLHEAGHEAEIIVVDDGSTHNLSQELTAFCNSVVYLRHDTSRGLSAARNTGIDHAKGCYIQFVDSDDTLCPEGYRQIIWLALHTADADIIQFDMPKWKSHIPTQNHNVITFDGSGTEYMLHHNLHAAACTYLFKHNILGELKFTDGIVHEDEEFSPQLVIRARRMITTTTHAYNYNHRPGSITTNRTPEWTNRRLDDLQGIICRIAQNAQTQPTNERKALTRRTNQLVMVYIYLTLKLTHSLHETRKRVKSLRLKQLYPLPIRTYTWKYWLFSIATRIIG